MNSYEEIITCEETKDQIWRLFNVMETRAYHKIRQERSLFPSQNYEKEYNKILKNNDFIKRINEKSIEKENKRFHERTPKGYYINEDCWNIIKSYLFKTNWISKYPVGMKLLKCLISKENLRLGFYIHTKYCRKIKNKCFDFDINIEEIKIIEVVNWTEYNVMVIVHHLLNFENTAPYHHKTNTVRCKIKDADNCQRRFQNNTHDIQYYFEDLYELPREKFEELKANQLQKIY